MAKMTCNFISYTLRRAVDITVIIPSVTIPESLIDKENCTHNHEPYPVLYLLHGYGNNHATWSGYSNVELYAEERQIAVVMLSAENKFYANHGNDDNYFDFVSKELPEFINATFPVSTRKEDTYIAGLSMGGFGALYHGLSHPERFAAIGSFSGAVNRQDNEGISPELLIKKHLKENTPIPPLYISIGKQDFLLDVNEQFIDMIDDLKLEYTSAIIDGYTHEWRFWDMEVEKFLDWIPRTDAYADKKRKV